jgi:hypothetical protein
MEPYRTLWNPIEAHRSPHGTPWNLVEGHGTLWNTMEFYGKFWKVLEDYVSMPYMDMESHGNSWNFLEHSMIFSSVKL